MAIDDLFERDLETFINDNTDPDALWLLLHIPKTAGSSLSAELDLLMPPYRNIHLLDEHYRRTDLTGERFWAQLDPMIEAMIAEDADVHFRSASGHMWMRQANMIRDAIGRTKIFTFLRNPVRRIVSDYNYQGSQQHPAWEEFVTNYPTIEAYIENPAEHNKIYKYLRRTMDEPVDELIARVRREFAFVGLVEMYPLSFNVLTRLFGLNHLPSQRVRTGRPDYQEISPEARARIIELNSLDLAIYEPFHAVMVAQRAAWQDLITADPGEVVAAEA